MINNKNKDIGTRIRQFRLAAGLTQTTLAEHLGISFQQLQKYERGVNRVSAFRLQQIAEILDVPISSFFEETATAGPHVESPSAVDEGVVQNEEERQMLKLFRAVKSSKVRKGVLEQLRVVVVFQDAESKRD